VLFYSFVFFAFMLRISNSWIHCTVSFAIFIDDLIQIFCEFSSARENLQRKIERVNFRNTFYVIIQITRISLKIALNESSDFW